MSINNLAIYLHRHVQAGLSKDLKKALEEKNMTEYNRILIRLKSNREQCLYETDAYI